MNTDSDIKQLADAIKAQTSTHNSHLLSPKNVNILVIAGIIGAFTLMWTNMTEEPKKVQDQFAMILSQNTEIKTTVLQTKTTVTDLSAKVDVMQRDQANQAGLINKNEAQIDALNDKIDSIEDRIKP